MSGPFCGADGRQCFRDTTKDKTCLLAGRCMGVEQAAVSPSAAIGIVGPDGRGVANGANATQRAQGAPSAEALAAARYIMDNARDYGENEMILANEIVRRGGPDGGHKDG